MDIVGERTFVEIAGDKTHELPPLLVRGKPHVPRLDRVVDMANNLIDSEDLIPSLPLDNLAHDQEVERRKMDLAINLVEQYLALIDHWQWGDGIVEWIRQCEITFEGRQELRTLLRPDIWPHAGRSSFVKLLEDKAIKAPGVELAEAVGLRLTFRQPPPLSCFSDQFLFYLNSSVAASAYHAWTQMNPEPVSSLPPERFTVQLVKM
jgi:hypothetical protein